MKRLHLKQRRGAIAVMTGLMAMALIMVMAIAIDFNRLWMVRNELQTSADAGALAGALQFLNSRDTLRITDSARAYAKWNRTLTDTVRVDSIQKGNWNASTRTFALISPSNAVNVVVSYAPTGIWMRGFGAVVPRMKARAVAWAAAPVSNTGCQKPWAIPYEELMYKINLFRIRQGDNTVAPASSVANMTRPFDQVKDIAALQQMTALDRTFSLKLGTGGSGAYNPTSGNYQAIRLGALSDALGNPYNPAPLNGGNAYRDHISGANGCASLKVGDFVEPEQGNKVGPTVQGACTGGNITAAMTACSNPAACAFLDGASAGAANVGNCYDPARQHGVDIKAAFFECSTTSCPGGSTPYRIKLLGSFTLTKVYPDDDKGKTPQYSKAEIQGIFKPLQASGPAGGGSTTLQKLVLTK